MEKTLILFKPDAVQRGLIGQILSAIEAKGFRILGLKLVQLTRDKAEEHYAPHKGKGFFNDVCTYMTSGPVVALIVGGHNAIKGMRQLVGATDPGQADPGSIRGRWAQTIDKNLIHGSDSQESSDREIPIFFSKAEILDFQPVYATWV